MIIVTLPLPSSLLSPNGRVYWRKHRVAVKEARETAFVLGLAASKSMRPKYENAKVSMVYDCSPPIKVKGYRPTDVQNALAACKSYIDGCIDAGIIVDDNSKCLSWGSCKIVKNGKPGVTLTFEEVLDA